MIVLAKDSGIGMILLGAGLLYFLSKNKNGNGFDYSNGNGSDTWTGNGNGGNGHIDGDGDEDKITTKTNGDSIEKKRPRTPSQISYENFRLGKPVKVKTGIYEIR